MGTRSTTKVFYEGIFVFGLYRQYDGYLSGHGKDLVEFMDSHTIVDGISAGMEKIINGPHHFGIVLVEYMLEKTGRGRGSASGNIYTTGEHDEQDYNYRIDIMPHGVDLMFIQGYNMTYTVDCYGDVLLDSGSLEDFKKLVEADE